MRFVLLVLVLAFACGDDDGPVDAAADARVGLGIAAARIDAAVDAGGTDTGTDAGTDDAASDDGGRDATSHDGGDAADDAALDDAATTDDAAADDAGDAGASDGGGICDDITLGDVCRTEADCRTTARTYECDLDGVRTGRCVPAAVRPACGRFTRCTSRRYPTCLILVGAAATGYCVTTEEHSCVCAAHSADYADCRSDVD